WGQRNESTMQDIEARFGDTVDQPGGPLGRWRKALSTVTDNGRLDGFGSDFTRRLGLEVVSPAIGSLTIDNSSVDSGDIVTIKWDCVSNPPGTKVRLEVQSPATGTDKREDLPLSGQQQFKATDSSGYGIVLTALYSLNGVERTASRELSLNVASGLK